LAFERFDRYTSHYYNKLLEKLHSRDHFFRLISSYQEKKHTDLPKPLTKEYLDQNREWLPRQNMQFIENAKEIYEAGLKASNHVKPILYHYSWHSFFAFLMYTFVRFDMLAGGHGISVPKMESNEIILEFHPFKKRGFFQRILDVLTILGYPITFARWILITEKNGDIRFVENNISPFANIERVNIRDLLKFKSDEYSKALREKFGDDLFRHDFVEIGNMNSCIMSFVTLFVASNISRYRPSVWAKILEGEGKYESVVLTQTRLSYRFYVYFVGEIEARFLRTELVSKGELAE